MNFVILIGRTTKDVELRQTSSGMAVALFTLAVDRRTREEADFIGCLAFDKTAETLARYVGRGTKIAVTGRIQTGSYVGKDGKKVFTTDVIVDSFEFCESRKQEPPQNAPPVQTAPAQPAPVSPTVRQIEEANETMGFSEINADDDLPF